MSMAVIPQQHPTRVPEADPRVPVMEEWDHAVPGDCEFADWKTLVEQSKLFVQERVAWGNSTPPPFILALHLYTIPCNLFRLQMQQGNAGERPRGSETLLGLHLVSMERPSGVQSCR
eukprot:3161831-Rhodomonas_salina.4